MPLSIRTDEKINDEKKIQFPFLKQISEQKSRFQKPLGSGFKKQIRQKGHFFGSKKKKLKKLVTTKKKSFSANEILLFYDQNVWNDQND